MTKPIAKWATFMWPADEEWRPVAGFQGYEVSDHGRIRSLRRASIDEATASQIKNLIRSTPKRKGSLKGIAQQLGISYQIVSGIAHKGTWSHVW